MIELVLFQEFHTGDILLNKEIVRNIIVCNPNLKVYYVLLKIVIVSIVTLKMFIY